MKWPDANLINAPPGWAEVDALLGRYTPPAQFGFVGTAGDMNRFWSRYRLAKSFREVAIDHFVPDTVKGYSALFRVFLTWSTFEHFMRICGFSLGTFAPLLRSYNPDALAAAIRAVPDHDKFLSAVLTELNRRPFIVNMRAFLAGTPCNVLIVPAAIRHIFAHGKLTPKAGAGHVKAACEIADLVCEFLFRTIDAEFMRRLGSHGVAVQVAGAQA